MTKIQYTHKQDEVDSIITALGRLQKDRGEAAVWEVLPDGWKDLAQRLLDIRNLGVLSAVEIFIREGLYEEGARHGAG